MKIIRALFAVSLGLALVACGGGGSSSGGGSNQFAGVYSGNHNVNFSANGMNFNEQIFLTLNVNGDGTYRIVDGDGGTGTIPATGTLDGNKFRATGSGSGTVDGITCNLRTTYAGTLDADSAKGTTTGNGTCSSSGVSINITYSGNFDLPQTGNSKQPKNGSFMHKAASML